MSPTGIVRPDAEHIGQVDLKDVPVPRIATGDRRQRLVVRVVVLDLRHREHLNDAPLDDCGRVRLRRLDVRVAGEVTPRGHRKPGPGVSIAKDIGGVVRMRNRLPVAIPLVRDRVRRRGERDTADISGERLPRDGLPGDPWLAGDTQDTVADSSCLSREQGQWDVTRLGHHQLGAQTLPPLVRGGRIRRAGGPWDRLTFRQPLVGDRVGRRNVLTGIDGQRGPDGRGA